MEISGASRWEDISYLTSLLWDGRLARSGLRRGSAVWRAVGWSDREPAGNAPYPGSTGQGVGQEAADGLSGVWGWGESQVGGAAGPRSVPAAVSRWRGKAWPPGRGREAGSWTPRRTRPFRRTSGHGHAQ